MLRAGRVTVRVDRPAAHRVATDHALVLVTDVTRQILNRATVTTPVRFGNLRGHNKMRAAYVAPPGARGEVYNDADYAEAVHDGSGPHIIRPRRAVSKRKTRKGKPRPAMLRFTVGGRTVYARQVMHPGTRARPWLARAAEQVAASNGFRWEPGR